MLFGYPATATAENWLHDCLHQILTTIHQNIDAGVALPNWPAIIPGPHRQQLRTRTGLRDRLATYITVAASLSPAERSQVASALNNQNDIAGLLSCTCHCEPISALPISIQPLIKDLFEYAFGLLTKLGIRDLHYKVVYNETRYHLCPFCGCEFFDAPGTPREALDHYLAESIYPFAAANLFNLTPMGNKCNSSYKFTADILNHKNGTRRRSFNPYNAPGVKLRLDDSVPFAGQDGQLPEWKVSFDLPCEEVDTWDSVFSIRSRYKLNHLDPDFKPWLDEFRHFCRVIKYRAANDQDVVTAVGLYMDFQDGLGFRDRAFMKAAVFRMLLHHCQNGNQRLLSLMRDLIPN